MPKPYPLDLRERVVGFVEEGRSRRAAAAHFRVSVSFVVKLMKAVRTRGSFAPKPLGGRRHAKLEPHRPFFWRRWPRRLTSPCRSWRPSSRGRPGRRRIRVRCRVGSFALATGSKKPCGRASKITPTSSRRARNGRKCANRGCGLSRTAWFFWTSDALSDGLAVCSAVIPAFERVKELALSLGL